MNAFVTYLEIVNSRGTLDTEGHDITITVKLAFKIMPYPIIEVCFREEKLVKGRNIICHQNNLYIESRLTDGYRPNSKLILKNNLHLTFRVGMVLAQEINKEMKAIEAVNIKIYRLALIIRSDEIIHSMTDILKIFLEGWMKSDIKFQTLWQHNTNFDQDYAFNFYKAFMENWESNLMIAYYPSAMRHNYLFNV